MDQENPAADELQDKIKISMEEASLPQLREFGAEMGIDVKLMRTMAKHVIIKKLAEAGWTQDHILVEDGSTPTAGAVKEGAVKEPMVEFTLPNQEGPGGKQALQVAVNGICILIPRSKRSRVKLRYYRALEIAVGSTVSLETDETTGKQEMVVTDAPSFPVQLHKMPSDEEIARWKEWEMKQPTWHNSYSRADIRRIQKEQREDQEAA